MARRKRVPTVGAKQLHPVQVSPEIRQLEAHRTKAAAHRAEQPVINADKSAVGLANTEFKNAAASARGGVNAEEDALTQALSGLKGSGLKGRYLQQAQNEFTSREADTASSLPALLAGAGEERTKALLAARTQLMSDRASAQSSAASAFSQRLKELRGEGSSIEKEEGKHHKEAEEKISAAYITAANGYQEILEAAKAGTEVEGVKVTAPKTEDEWRKFAETVAKHSTNTNLPESVKAVELLRKKLEAKKVGQIARGPFG